MSSGRWATPGLHGHSGPGPGPRGALPCGTLASPTRGTEEGKDGERGARELPANIGSSSSLHPPDAHLTFLLKTSPPLPGRLVPLAELQRLPPYNKPYISLLQLK